MTDPIVSDDGKLRFIALEEMNTMTTATAKTPAKKPAAKPVAKKAATKSAVKKPTAPKTAVKKTVAKPTPAPVKKAPAKVAKVNASTMALDLGEVLKAFAAKNSARTERLPGNIDKTVKAALVFEAKRLKISVSALVAAIVTQYIGAIKS